MEYLSRTNKKQLHKAEKRSNKLESRKLKKTPRPVLSVKLYLYLMLQLLTLVVVFMYMAFTINLYPFNYLWVIVFLMLTIVGFILGFMASLISSMFVIFGYGSIILYQLYVVNAVAALSLNDLFWLFAFPVGAMVSGLLGNELNAFTQMYLFYKKTSDELVTIDSVTGLANERQFRLDLSKEIFRTLRYGHSTTVLMMEISYFNEMIKDYGKETTEHLLKQMSEQIEEVLRYEDKKAYLGDGVFGAILPETKVDQVEYVIKRLNDQLKTCKLESAKGRREIEIQMKYGYSGCPEQYQTVNELYEEAKRMLGVYAV